MAVFDLNFGEGEGKGGWLEEGRAGEGQVRVISGSRYESGTEGFKHVGSCCTYAYIYNRFTEPQRQAM